MIRVLKRQTPPSLEKLGMSLDNLEFVRELVNRPQGTVLVTGPTGSGAGRSLSRTASRRDFLVTKAGNTNVSSACIEAILDELG